MKGLCSQKSDIWSTGISLLFLICGSEQLRKFEKMSRKEYNDYMLNLPKNDYEILNNYPFIKKILKNCLLEDAEKRLDAKGLLELFETEYGIK
ncbi:hypothetical protein COBT_003331 [Conglomerata obtusa]